GHGRPGLVPRGPGAAGQGLRPLHGRPVHGALRPGHPPPGGVVGVSPAVATGPERIQDRPEGWTIVLCAGPINYTHLPIGTNVSNAMIPINGRPVIGWILDDLLRKSIGRVAVVVRGDDARCHEFVRRAYAGRMELRIAPLDGGTILHSLQAGLRAAQATDGSLHVVLGDTMI